MNHIDKQVQEDHIRFANHYLEILNTNSRFIIKNRQATRTEDMTLGFDYALEINKTKIAVRTRDNEYLKYGDFTIRSYNKGYVTEIDKIREGHGDLYLYCWKTSCGKRIYKYLLIDIEKLRKSGLLDNPDGERGNGDGTKFIYIKPERLHKYDCVLAHSIFQEEKKTA